MLKRIAVATAMLLAVLSPRSASAQTDSRFIAGAGVGIARTWDDESLLGTGLLTEGRIGWAFTPKAQIELAMTHVPYNREFESGVATEGRSIFTSVALKYDFSSGTVRPFVMAGYGLNNHRGTRVSPPDFESETSTTDHGYVLGTGFTVNRGRWQIGPEARVYMMAIESDASAAMMLTGSMRASLRF
jgi:hypothetical protein